MPARNKGRAKKRAQTKMEDIPMTPMIDVVFQLLIYFIFTFEPIDMFAHLQVYRPAADPNAKPGDPQPNIVKVTVFANGYSVNDTFMRKDRLGDLLFQIADLDKDQTIMIIATATSPHEKLVQLLDLCTQAGLHKFTIISSG